MSEERPRVLAVSELEQRRDQHLVRLEIQRVRRSIDHHVHVGVPRRELVVREAHLVQRPQRARDVLGATRALHQQLVQLLGHGEMLLSHELHQAEHLVQQLLARQALCHPHGQLRRQQRLHGATHVAQRLVRRQRLVEPQAHHAGAHQDRLRDALRLDRQARQAHHLIERRLVAGLGVDRPQCGVDDVRGARPCSVREPKVRQRRGRRRRCARRCRRRCCRARLLTDRIHAAETEDIEHTLGDGLGLVGGLGWWKVGERHGSRAPSIVARPASTLLLLLR